MIPSLSSAFHNAGSCLRDEDCGSQFFHCRLDQATLQPSCQFKSLLFYPTLWELSAFVVCFFVSIIAATSGVGGGALFMPALIIIGGMPSSLAPIFSQVLIFGTMLMNFIYFFFQKAPIKKPLKDLDKPQDPKAAKFAGTSGNSLSSPTKPPPKPFKIEDFGYKLQNYVSNWIKDYFTKRPVVQFDCFCVLQPASLAGTILGVMLNSMLPDWCILAMLCCFTCYTASTSYKKGMNLRKKFLAAQAERKKKQLEAMKRRKDENYGTEMAKSPPKSPRSPMSDKQAYGDDELIVETYVIDEPKPTRMEISLKWMLKLFEFDSNLNIPLHKLGFLAIGWVIVFCSSIAKGSKRSKSVFDIQNCSKEWWIITLGLFPVFILMSYIYSVIVMVKYYSMQAIEKALHKIDEEKKPKDGVVVEMETPQKKAEEEKIEYFQRVKEYDVDFHLKNTIMMPFWGFISGVVASMLGIGGGMVIVPVMNALGVDPQVAASTSSSMIFSTSMGSIIQFILFGLLPWDYFIVLTIVAAFGCFMGQFIIGSIVRKTGKTYLVLFVLVFMVLIALFLTIIQTFIAFYKSMFLGQYSGLSSPCS